MVVLHGRLKSKALACLVFSNFLLVSAQAHHVHGSFKSFPPGNRFEKAEIQVQKEVIQINKQVTVLLPGKEIRVFQYSDVENEKHNLSVTIFPCGSLVKWSFTYGTFNKMDKENITTLWDTEHLYEITSMETVTISNAKKGTYFLVFYPIGTDTLAGIYITMDDGGPYELTIPQRPNIMLTPQRRHRLKVTWEQSLLNPQNTSYCLVVNTKKEYPSLCGAEQEGFVMKGSAVPVLMPVVINLNNLKLDKKKKGTSARIQKGIKPNNDTVIVCVDRKMQLTFTKLKKGVKYYFNLFAINNKTNLTIPYGKSYIEYNLTAKPINLKDGVRKLVDLKKLEGKAFFRYKVSKYTKELNFYVLVCGGVVDVEVKSKGSSRRRKGRKIKNHHSERLPKPTKVFGYKRFRIFYPAEGEQLYLKVNAPNVDELTRIKYVEVFMTSHPGRRYPLPYLPENPTLYEFKSQKTCNSVTIGWIPTHDGFINTYCVAVWENRKFDYTDLFRGYFQCYLDEVPQDSWFLSTPKDATVSKDCEDMIISNKKSVTNYKIRDLKPATSYTIQVTVKKKNGRTLSYKYLKAYTKHSCDY